MHRPTAVVIDTDAGIDDVVTLALAARSPEIELAGVTTTYGNASLAHTTRNARTVLALAGRPDIPVSPGADRPLVRQLVTGVTLHGPSGVGHATVPPAPPAAPEAHALLRVLQTVRGPVTLLTLGPLTNLAQALERDAPLVLRAVERHIAMLGAFAERATPDRLADFNAWADPEAVQRVLAAGLPTRLVPLDVTRRMVLSVTDVARLATSGDELTRWLAAALQFYAEAQRRARGTDGCVVHDALPLGEVLSPGLLAWAERRVAVDLDEDERRGHTREAADGVLLPVATSVDVTHMRLLLERVLSV